MPHSEQPCQPRPRCTVQPHLPSKTAIRRRCRRRRRRSWGSGWRSGRREGKGALTASRDSASSEAIDLTSNNRPQRSSGETSIDRHRSLASRASLHRCVPSLCMSLYESFCHCLCLCLSLLLAGLWADLQSAIVLERAVVARETGLARRRVLRMAHPALRRPNQVEQRVLLTVDADLDQVKVVPSVNSTHPRCTPASDADSHRDSHRDTQRHTETHRDSHRDTQRHTETHRDTQRHTATATETATETHRDTQRQPQRQPQRRSVCIQRVKKAELRTT